MPASAPAMAARAFATAVGAVKPTTSGSLLHNVGNSSELVRKPLRPCARVSALEAVGEGAGSGLRERRAREGEDDQDEGDARAAHEDRRARRGRRGATGKPPRPIAVKSDSCLPGARDGLPTCPRRNPGERGGAGRRRGR